jgi:hypothetical protein
MDLKVVGGVRRHVEQRRFHADRDVYARAVCSLPLTMQRKKAEKKNENRKN